MKDEHCLAWEIRPPIPANTIETWEWIEESPDFFALFRAPGSRLWHVVFDTVDGTDLTCRQYKTMREAVDDARRLIALHKQRAEAATSPKQPPP